MLVNFLVAISRYIFFTKTSRIYIFLFAHFFGQFCKNLANGSIKVVEAFTSGSSFYQSSMSQMLRSIYAAALS